MGHHGHHSGPEWQSSLLNCTPCGTCCLGTWCPCLLVGRTSSRMENPSDPNPDQCNSACMIMCAINSFTGCGWIYAMIKRTEIRERYGIKGGGCGDCCATYWCPCCALIQQEKEVKARNESGVIVQGYQSNKSGMVMPQSHQYSQPQHQQHQQQSQPLYSQEYQQQYHPQHQQQYAPQQGGIAPVHHYDTGYHQQTKR